MDPKDKLATVTNLVDAVDAFAEKYEDQLIARFGMHLLPHLGPAIDVLIAGRGARIYKDRVEHFLNDLKARLEKIEISPTLDLSSPAFLDVLRVTLENVERTRSATKRELFAQLLAGEVSKARGWEDTEIALRLLSQLEEIHIQILALAFATPVCDGVWNTWRVVTLVDDPLSAGSREPLVLVKALPQYAPPVIRLACAELVSLSLLHDEGIGRMDVRAMQYFVPSESAFWLRERLFDDITSTL